MKTERKKVPARILIVEDNPIEVIMIKIALKKAGYKADPLVVDDGEPALALLKRVPPYENEALPDLVILDLNLKKVDGPEVLHFIRHTPDCSRLVVAVLSSFPEDVMKAKADQADCYFRKTDQLEEFLKLGDQLLACHAVHHQ